MDHKFKCLQCQRGEVGFDSDCKYCLRPLSNADRQIFTQLETELAEYFKSLMSFVGNSEPIELVLKTLLEDPPGLGALAETHCMRIHLLVIKAKLALVANDVGTANTMVPEGLVRDRVREDVIKLDSIYQYLISRGLVKTLAQLEAETEYPYPGASQVSLDLLIDTYLASNAHSVEKDSTEGIPIPGVCVLEVDSAIPSFHGMSNPTCVVWHPSDSEILLTGGADSRVVMVKSGEILDSFTLPSPPLSIDWAESNDVAIACMGGELVWMNVADKISFIKSTKPHNNSRVNSVKFSTSFAASCGKDISALIWKKISGVYEIIASVRCMREIASIAWAADDVVCVAETGNCMIQLHKVDENVLKPIGEICMNLSLSDPRTEYTALAMCVEGKFLAVSTSRNSALLFSLPKKGETCTPLKVFYGMSVGIYDVPAISFSIDCSFVYVTSDKEILVFECATAHKAFTIEISNSRTVRGMAHHRLFDQIATVSFDKQLSILK